MRPSQIHDCIASRLQKTCLLACRGRGIIRVCGAVRRVGLSRHHASSADGAFLLDRSAARSFPRVSRVWRARARRANFTTGTESASHCSCCRRIVLGTAIAKLPIFASYEDTDPTVRNIVVSCTTNIMMNVVTALICYQFLRSCGFDIDRAVAGVLALLLCTTHLHYTQNMMENNYIMLLTLAGFSISI